MSTFIVLYKIYFHCIILVAAFIVYIHYIILKNFSLNKRLSTHNGGWKSQVHLSWYSLQSWRFSTFICWNVESHFPKKSFVYNFRKKPLVRTFPKKSFVCTHLPMQMLCMCNIYAYTHLFPSFMDHIKKWGIRMMGKFSHFQPPNFHTSAPTSNDANMPLEFTGPSKKSSL